MAIVVIAFIVFVERAQRRLLIQYPKRQVGNRMFQGEASHLPLKLNTAGRHSADLRVVAAAAAGDGRELHRRFRSGAGCARSRRCVGHGQPLYMALYAGLIIFFAFFYTAVVFNPADTADNLKKHGGFIPGIRPGKNTADYIDYVLTRITRSRRDLPGARLPAA